MTRTSRGKTRRTRGAGSRRGPPRNIKSGSLTSPVIVPQKQDRGAPTLYPDARIQPFSAENEAPQVLLPVQKEGAVANSTQAPLAFQGLSGASARRPRPTVAHRPCTRSQTGAVTSRTSYDDRCVKFAKTEVSVDDHPTLTVSGRAEPVVEGPIVRTFAAKLESATVQVKRGRPKRKFADEEASRGELPKKRRVGCNSQDTRASAVPQSSGKKITPDVARTKFAQPDAATVDQCGPEEQLESIPRSGSFRTTNTSQSRKPSRGRAPSRRRSRRQSRGRRTPPPSVAAPQGQIMVVSAAGDPTRPPPQSLQMWEGGAEISADDILSIPVMNSESFPVSPECIVHYTPFPRFELTDMPCRYLCTCRQYQEEPPEEKPYYFFSRELPEPGAPGLPGGRRNERVASTHENSQLPSLEESEAERVLPLGNNQALPSEEAEVETVSTNDDNQIPLPEEAETGTVPPHESRNPPSPENSELRGDSTPKDSQVLPADESEIKSPTSTEKWRKRLRVFLSQEIPDSVLEAARADIPSFELPEKEDLDVSFTRYLEYCRKVVPEKVPSFKSSDAAAAAPAEDDGARSPARPVVEHADASESNAQADPTTSEAPDSQAVSNSTTVLTAPSTPPEESSVVYISHDARLSPPPTAQHQSPTSASPSHVEEGKLHMCQSLLQKYKTCVLARLDGDRWRNLLGGMESMPDGEVPSEGASSMD